MARFCGRVQGVVVQITTSVGVLVNTVAPAITRNRTHTVWLVRS